METARRSFVNGQNADGRFGADTERAVRTLQTRLGMTVDGIVGPDTWRVLQSGGGPTD